MNTFIFGFFEFLVTCEAIAHRVHVFSAFSACSSEPKESGRDANVFVRVCPVLSACPVKCGAYLTGVADSN